MNTRQLFRIAFLLLIATLVAAQDLVTEGYLQDPYLKYRPPFVRSLPVQILLTGVVLTLTVVLLIHLLFTAQYHWPLAPVNYVLQISGVTTLLISLIATIHVVLSASREESESWPYMLSYIAVDVPPRDMDESEGWSVAEKATWAVMTASTSGLVQITHIQFLTLLYPSRLEKQLIFALLGPLAVVAAVMQLIPISASDNVTSVSLDVKNVCNATLSLLFTVALFIWGILINRKQAWRTDGGTAVFGGAALVLALVSTALNFIYVHRGEDEILWFPGLMWAVVLWQSFLGWWWWVGAGSGGVLHGSIDVEEKMRKEAKRENRRREAKERRQETKQRAKKVLRDVFGRDSTITGETSSAQSKPPSSSQVSRIRKRSSPGDPSSSSIEVPQSIVSDEPPTSLPHSLESSSASSSSGTSFVTFCGMLSDTVRGFYSTVRQAHVIATEKQAAERVQRIRAMERSGVSESSRPAWGVSNLLWRTKPRDTGIGRYPDTDVEEDRVGGAFEMHSTRQWRGNQSQDRGDEEVMNEEITTSEEDPEIEQSRRSTRRREITEDEYDKAPSINFSNGSRRAATSVQDSPVQPGNRPRSLWWWGPLERWRLQDSTTYS